MAASSTNCYVGFLTSNLLQNTTNINGAGTYGGTQWWIYSLTWNVFLVRQQRRSGDYGPSSPSLHVRKQQRRRFQHYLNATNFATARYWHAAAVSGQCRSTAIAAKPSYLGIECNNKRRAPNFSGLNALSSAKKNVKPKLSFAEKLASIERSQLR